MYSYEEYEPVSPHCVHKWKEMEQHVPMTSSFEPQTDFVCSVCSMSITCSSGVVQINPRGRPRYYSEWEAVYGKSPYTQYDEKQIKAKNLKEARHGR